MTLMLRKLFRAKKHQIVVLMYHRIAAPKTDPWQLAVTSENFEQHLEVLKKYHKVISIQELTKQIVNNKIEANSVCITFDDAYSDNYLYAKPLLEKYSFPAAFFVPTNYISQQKLFWWDELEMLILHSPKLPSEISIYLNGSHFQFKIEQEVLTEEDWRKHTSWKWPDTPPTKRCELYLKLWEKLRPLPYDEITVVMEELKRWAGYETDQSGNNYAMNSQQLTHLSNQSLLSLGIHTHTHPALDCHSKSIQQQEIKKCKDNLEQHYFKKINAIAYPYGCFDKTTLTVAAELKITIGFTTRPEAITSSSLPLCLGRFQVVNWPGNDFKKQLENWFK